MIGHVFDLYLIVERHCAGGCFDGGSEEGFDESKNSGLYAEMDTTEIKLVPNLSPLRHIY